LATEAKLRAHLGRFGFAQERSEVAIGNLSGGEKARGLFAMICLASPHLLLLDEPSNHLDVDSRQALIQGLNEYDGAVILISHDAHMIEAIADRLWYVADGGCQPFEGDLTDYRQSVMRRLRSDGQAGNASSPINQKETAKARRRDAAAKREALAPLRRTIAEAEKAMQRLTNEKQKLEDKFADPGLYDDPSTKAADLQMALADVERQLGETEEKWLTAQEALESAEANA
ncbi:MAG: ATP-binding cassette domain-containing protein, partial [Pseudomonadota bacterium]